MKRFIVRAAAALLTAWPVGAWSEDAVHPASAGEAVTLEDGSRLWFVELFGPPTTEGGDLGAIERGRAAFKAGTAQAGLRYQERHAFSKLWNGLSIAVDPADVGKLQRMTGIAGLYPVVAIEVPPVRGVNEPELLTALAMTGADVAQNALGLTGAGIKVGIIDTGLDYDHPDLGGDGVTRTNSSVFPTARVVAGYDFVGDEFNGVNTPVPDPYPDDCYGHGTHVSGIVGASGRVRGVAPGVTLCAYRVFGCAGNTPSDILIQAMERALDDGVQIVNMSLGTAFEWPDYPTGVASNRLVSKGVVVCASIGNNGESGLYSGGAPGLGEKVIGVAAFDSAAASSPSSTGGLISGFSSFGVAPDLTLKPDIGAPGGSIYSTYPLEQGGYTILSGTSMASAHVTGAVALLLQAHPGTPSNAVRDILMNSAEPHASASDPAQVEAVHRQGAGMLNIPGAIQATTRIEPGKLSLGESEFGPVTRTLVIHNRASSDVTYDLSNLSALGTGSNTFQVTYNHFPASVTFHRNPVSVPANGSATVDVSIAPHPDQPARTLYGGYIVFSPRGGGPEYRVPYAGFCGDYQTIPSLTSAGSFGLPWLTQRVGTFYFNRSLGATYTMVGDDVPFIIFHLDHQPSLLRMEVFDAGTGRAWHRAFQRKHMPRNANSVAASVIGWRGTTTFGKRTETVPDGRYVMKVSVLRALGEEGNPAHWDYWTSPVMTLARPAPAEAVTGVGDPLPGALALAPPRPNPSSGEVAFRFDLPQAGPVSLDVFDLGGRRLRGWRWASLPAGEHSVRWDGASDTGSPTAAGMVVCRLSAMGRTLTRKAVRLP